MNNNIITIFPTTLYVKDDVLPKDELKNHIEEITKVECDAGGNNWASRLKNSLGTYNLLENSVFSKLNSIVENEVNEFNKIMGSDFYYKCRYSWFNIYDRGDYQEYHHHAHSTYSAVFFLKSNEKSSPLIFLNPSEPYDMHPILNQKIFNDLNYQIWKLNSVENRLVIFRSFIKHMVPKHEDDETRITLAYNF